MALWSVGIAYMHINCETLDGTVSKTSHLFKSPSICTTMSKQTGVGTGKRSIGVSSIRMMCTHTFLFNKM